MQKGFRRSMRLFLKTLALVRRTKKAKASAAPPNQGSPDERPPLKASPPFASGQADPDTSFGDLRLPLEVWVLILHELDVADAECMSRVCRSLRTPAQAQMVYELRLYPDTVPLVEEPVVVYFRSFPARGIHVRELVTDSPTVATTILGWTSRLEALNLTVRAFDRSPYDVPGALKNITTLRRVFLSFPRAKSAHWPFVVPSFRSLTASTQLRTLDLESVIVKDSDWMEVGSVAPFALLSRLSLVDVDAPVAFFEWLLGSTIGLTCLAICFTEERELRTMDGPLAILHRTGKTLLQVKMSMEPLDPSDSVAELCPSVQVVELLDVDPSEAFFEHLNEAVRSLKFRFLVQAFRTRQGTPGVELLSHELDNGRWADLKELRFEGARQMEPYLVDSCHYREVRVFDYRTGKEYEPE